MKEKEVWKVYKDTRLYTKNDKYYRGSLWEVSDQGNVKKNNKLYECRLNKRCKVFGSVWKVHRAVAELFIPNQENKSCIDHINGNPLDNRVCNLRWVTYKENNNNPITRQRKSEAAKGKTQSEETRKKRSKSMKGKNTSPRSEESNRKRSESMKGKTQSEETRKKRSKSMKRYWQNKKLNKYHFE